MQAYMLYLLRLFDIFGENCPFLIWSFSYKQT